MSTMNERPSTWFIPMFVLGYLLLLWLAWLVGWGHAHHTVATECKKLGGFYVGDEVFQCKQIEGPSMTNNKPEVVAWHTPPTRDTLPVVALNSRSQRGEPLIRLSDYEALQAENDALRAKTSMSIGVGDGTGNLFVHGGYDSIKRVQELIFECEKLRKVADKYQRLLELGEDFHWENIIHVDISEFSSRADAIDTILGESK